MARSKTEILGSGEFEYTEGEVASGETIYPGMIVEASGRNGDGSYVYQPVSSIEKIGESFRVALTPNAPPKGSDADIPREHEYSAGENLQVAICYPGSVVQNALLADGGVLTSSADANTSVDDALGTNDDGTLQVTTAGGSVVARARESVDNSTGGGGEGNVDAARIEVEVV